MSELSEFKVIQRFREHLDRERLTEDTNVVYRIAGGMPHERIEHEFRLSGVGKATVKMRDELKGIPPQEAPGNLDQEETRDLLQQIGVSLDELVPRSKAQFLPDSVVGSITFEFDGEETTLFFLADEEQRVADEAERLPDEEKHLAQERVAVSPITQTVRRISEVSQRLLGSQKEQGDE